MSAAASWRFCSRGRERSSWAWVGRCWRRVRCFRAAFEEVCGHVDGLLDMPLRDVLFAEEGSEAAAKLDETAYAQPALFAVEVALFRQLEQWGVAARHAAGALHRRARGGACGGRVVAGGCLPGGGGAWPVDAGAARQAERWWRSRRARRRCCRCSADGVEIAGLNGPRSTVISGDEAAVVALAEHFRREGRRPSVCR